MRFDSDIKRDVEQELQWDAELARDAVAALKRELPYSADRIKVVVMNGTIRLEGAVEWNYQKQRAEQTVRRVKGVRGVINTTTVKPSVAPSEIKRRIEEATNTYRSHHGIEHRNQK